MIRVPNQVLPDPLPSKISADLGYLNLIRGIKQTVFVPIDIKHHFIRINYSGNIDNICKQPQIGTNTGQANPMQHPSIADSSGFDTLSIIP